MSAHNTPSLYEVFGTAGDTAAPYLAVRTAPATSSEQVDTLVDGTLVVKVEEGDGWWWQISSPVGVVTGTTPPDRELSSFNSGWVNSQYLAETFWTVAETDEASGSLPVNRIDAFQQTLLGGMLQNLVAPCAEIPSTATTADADIKEALASKEAINADATSGVSGSISLPDVDTATLYIDISGTPDIERFTAETLAIAERRAQDVLQEYPLPEDRLFVILGGNESGLFRIENSSEGSIVFGEQLATEEVSDGTEIDKTTDVGDTEGNSTSRGSSLIKDLAKVCAAPPIPEDAGAEDLFEVAGTGEDDGDGFLNLRETADAAAEVILSMAERTRLRKLDQTESGSWYKVEIVGGNVAGTQGWANARFIAQTPIEGGDEDLPEEAAEEVAGASPRETTDELAELVEPGSEFAAQNPKIAATLEIIRSSPSSTHTLSIGIILSDPQDSKKSTIKEYLSKFNTEKIGLEMLSGSGFDKTVTDATEIGGKLETQESLVYALKINIEDITVNPEDQLPTEVAIASEACAPTLAGAAGENEFGGDNSGDRLPLGGDGERVSFEPHGLEGLRPLPSLSACSLVVDVRSEYLDAASVYGDNDISKINTIVLHQMSCRSGDIGPHMTGRRPESNAPPGTMGDEDAEGNRIKRGRGAHGWRRWLKLHVHFFVSNSESSVSQGGPRAYRIQNWNERTPGSHGFNTDRHGYAAAQIEIEGKFPGRESDRDDEHDTLTQEQANAAIDLCRCIIAEVGATEDPDRPGTFGRILYVTGHRHAYSGKPSDPGEAVWKMIAVPVMEEHGLQEGPTLGGGYIVPEIWDPRKVGVAWRQTAAQD